MKRFLGNEQKTVNWKAIKENGQVKAAIVYVTADSSDKRGGPSWVRLKREVEKKSIIRQETLDPFFSGVNWTICSISGGGGGGG